MAAVARLTRRTIHDVILRDWGGGGGGYGGEGRPAPIEREATVPDGLPEMEQDRIALFVIGPQMGVKHEDCVEQWRKKYGDAPWDK